MLAFTACGSSVLPEYRFPKNGSKHTGPSFLLPGHRRRSSTNSSGMSSHYPVGGSPPSPASSFQNQEDISSYPEIHEAETFEEKLPWTEEQEHLVREPFDYVYSQKGKNLRGQMMAALNACLKVSEKSAAIIDHIVGMLHTASLLIDDIEDGSDLRRGQPASHVVYGVPQTINSANYIYFLALQELQKLSNPTVALQIFTEELMNLHRGQGMDLFWRDSFLCPTEEQYVQMVADKTGGLFRILARLMMLESPTDMDFLPFIDLVGVLFQIRDDYMNLSNSQYTSEKGLAEDLTEGKFSFPIIHAIRSDPSNHVLMNIMRSRTQDDEVKRYAVGYMEDMGSFEHCRVVLGKLMARAREELVRLRTDGAEIALTNILDKLDLESGVS